MITGTDDQGRSIALLVMTRDVTENGLRFIRTRLQDSLPYPAGRVLTILASYPERRS
jgi:hypothetical protein